MHRRMLFAVGALLATSAAFGQTVTVTLDSAQAGQTVPPGSIINWTISFGVSSGDNQGLALLSSDLTQDAGNPALIDIPPADGVPAAMNNFSRPAGISNPGEGNPSTGYPGVQRGPAGAMNVRQIGGGQNNFGQALPGGSGLGENANVLGGVGQSAAEVLASGSFVAPSACGTYTFNLANIAANVVAQLNAPPAFSPVAEALVDATAGTFSFSVGLVGDIDGNGAVELADLAVELSAFGSCSGDPSYVPAADFDNSGCVDLADLAVQLSAFGQTCG